MVADSGRNVHLESDKFLDVQFVEPATRRACFFQVATSQHIRAIAHRWHGQRKWETRQQNMDENMNEAKPTAKTVPIDGANFDAEVLQSQQPVLVAFLTSWSRPCAILAPVLDEIASECADKLKVGRVDADASLDLSLWYDVDSIPTLLYFVAGTVRAKIIGTATKEAILVKLLTRKAS